MTEHKHPEAFPEHVRPYLLPLPETQWEALFLLRCMDDVNEAIRERNHSAEDSNTNGSTLHSNHAAT